MKAESKTIMDVLSDVLSVSKMGSSVICEPVLPAPWGMKFEPAAKATHAMSISHIGQPITQCPDGCVAVDTVDGMLGGDDTPEKQRRRCRDACEHRAQDGQSVVGGSHRGESPSVTKGRGRWPGRHRRSG